MANILVVIQFSSFKIGHNYLSDYQIHPCINCGLYNNSTGSKIPRIMSRLPSACIQLIFLPPRQAPPQISCSLNYNAQYIPLKCPVPTPDVALRTLRGICCKCGIQVWKKTGSTCMLPTAVSDLSSQHMAPHRTFDRSLSLLQGR